MSEWGRPIDGGIERSEEKIVKGEKGKRGRTKRFSQALTLRVGKGGLLGGKAPTAEPFWVNVHGTARKGEGGDGGVLAVLRFETKATK